MKRHTGEIINELIKAYGKNNKLEILCQDGFQFSIHFGKRARGFPSLDDAEFFDYLEVYESSEYEKEFNLYITRAKLLQDEPVRYDYVPAEIIDGVIASHMGLDLSRQLTGGIR